MKHSEEPCSRRQFFSAFRDHALLQGHALRNEMKGVKMMTFDDLASVPSETLRRTVPMVRPGLAVRIDGDAMLHVRRPQGAEEEALRKLSEVERFIYNNVNGRATVEDIACALASAFALSEDEAYAKTRDLFIEFSKRLICQPTTP